MNPSHTHRLVLAALLILVVVTPSRAEKPTKAEIGKAGKAATAFLDVPGFGPGTAFCVHPSGLFVTNEHNLRGENRADLKLVLDAGLKTQRVLPATVVRTDKALDLALVRVASKEPLPALSLGTGDGVTELAEVVTFGFPPGAGSTRNRKEYPAITVTAGSVAVLRRKAGELDRLQLAVSVPFGTSGGPVLDADGKVIGVIGAIGYVAPGNPNTNFAIPVDQLTRFLHAPTIQLTPPDLAGKPLDRPAEFRAKVVAFVPGTKEPALKLVLAAGDQAAREFPMAARDGVYSATAVPVPRAGGGRVEIAVRIGTGSVTGLTDDLTLQVGGKPVKLSQVRQIHGPPKPGVVLTDGRTIDGEPGGLGPADVALGDQTVKVDLRKAAHIRVTPPAEIYAVMAVVVATVDGREVARAEASIPVRTTGGAAAPDPATVPITPPAGAADREVRKLPEPFDDVCLGGGGRYLILHLPKLKKLAVFDFSAGRVTHYVAVAEEKVFFAAGLDKLVVGLPKAGVLERWSLTTFERELTVFPPFTEEIQRVVLGHASAGPVVVNAQFLDLGTLKPIPVRFPRDGFALFASGDGSLMTRWGEEAVSFVREGDQMVQYREGGLGHAIPGPDGRWVFTSHGPVTAQLKRADPEDANPGFCIPAVRGNYFLSLTGADGAGKGGRLSVYLVGYPRPVAKPDNIEHGIRTDREWDSVIVLGAWKRVYFVPDANLIAVLPPTNDQVVLYKFDVNAALDASGVDYLFVTSQPPRAVRAGAKLTYPVAAKAKRKPVTFRLETGPAGMAVSADGEVTWAVPADAPAGEQQAVLTVRDAGGQEVFHTFAVRVVK